MNYNPLNMVGADGSSYIVKEIAGQPELWGNTYRSLADNQKELLDFFGPIFKIKDLRIILSGAGSSAFIGEILEQSFYKNTGIPTKAISTTDLVTHPRGLLGQSAPTLLVSFARSGSSPESIASFELVEKLNEEIFHLIITCNADGDLAKRAAGSKRAYVFLLPPVANDQALAMTGSFTSMLLAGLLISDIKNIKKNEPFVKELQEYGKRILNKFTSDFRTIASLDFKRVVFLGSGALKGTARESHLKVLEMTDGQIICQYDSFLGFRHGPRAAVDASTLLVYLFSGDPYVFKYEKDLVQSINETEDFLFCAGIGQGLSAVGNLDLDLIVDLGNDKNKIPDDFFSVCSVLPAQLLGFYKSLALGLMPDSPSQNGGINRIVQGVTIYPY